LLLLLNCQLVFVASTNHPAVGGNDGHPPPLHPMPILPASVGSPSVLPVDSCSPPATG
jgi:hypothetical protein